MQLQDFPSHLTPISCPPFKTIYLNPVIIIRASHMHMGIGAVEHCDIIVDHFDTTVEHCDITVEHSDTTVDHCDSRIE